MKAGLPNFANMRCSASVDTAALLPSSTIRPFLASDKTLRAATFGPASFYKLESATAPLAMDKQTLSASTVSEIQQKISEGKIKIANAVLLKDATQNTLDVLTTLNPLNPALSVASQLFEHVTDYIAKNAAKQTIDLNVFSVLLEQGATLERQAKFKHTAEGRYTVINDLYFVDVQGHPRAILPRGRDYQRSRAGMLARQKTAVLCAPPCPMPR